jgi:hypothetical protein
LYKINESALKERSMAATSELRISPPQPDIGGRVLRWVPRIAVTVWAGFWGWFVLMAGSSDLRQGLAGTGPILAAWLGGLATLVIAVWARPRLGGILMVAAGVAAAYLFPRTDTRLILALPAGVIGLAALLSPHAGRMPR